MIDEKSAPVRAATEAALPHPDGTPAVLARLAKADNTRRAWYETHDLPPPRPT